MEKTRRHILVITPKLPKPDRNAGDRRLIAILEMMARTDRVDLCVDLEAHLESPPVGKAEADRYRSMCRSIGVNVIGFGPLPHPRQLFRRGYDVVIFEFYYMIRRYGRLVSTFAASAKTIVDSVDIHFLRAQSAVAVGADSYIPTQDDINEELNAYRRADATIVVTSDEVDALSNLAEIGQLYLIPIIVTQRLREDRPRKQQVLFIGGFSHAPNVDGIVWFIREIWPQVLAKVPDACIKVIGSNPPHNVVELRCTPGVELLGYVPDTNPYLDEAMVSVAPLRFGAGMKGKVIEAMASGLPLVTTAFGAQGLGASNEEHLLLADDAVTFASCVVSMLTDVAKANRMGLEGQRLVKDLCSPEVVQAAMSQMLDEVSPYTRFGTIASIKNLGLQMAMAIRGIQFVRTFMRRSKLHVR